MAENTRSIAKALEELNMRMTNYEEQNAEVMNQLQSITTILSNLGARVDKLETDGKQHSRAVVTEDNSCTSPIFSPDNRARVTPAARSVKIDMPRFNGDNPHGWIFKAEQYFAYYGISDDQRFMFVAIHMDGPALNWYQWMHQNYLLTTWQGFKLDLLRRFGPSLYRDLSGELTKLQQLTTVQDFYNRFEELSNQISGIPASFLQSCFESGLKPAIRREVRALQPTSLLQAFQLATLMEDRIEETKLTAPQEFYSKVPPTSLKFPTTTQPTANPIISQSKTYLPIQKLTPSQMDDRRAKGLCFNCDEKFHKGHQCQAKLFAFVLTNEEYEKLDYIESDSEKNEYQQKENPEISPHSYFHQY